MFYLNKDWGCVILREIDFLLKICWSIPCLHPSWKVHTWLAIVMATCSYGIYFWRRGGISFHTNASTSVAVTKGTSFSFLRTCSYLMLHCIKIPNLVLYDLDWLFKLKTHRVAEESERLICEIYTKTKFYKIYVVTVNKHNYQRPKKLLLFRKYFHFWQWLIKYSVVVILTPLTWCSILYFLFIVQHLLTFKHCFCFFGFKDRRQLSYIQCSVLIALLF